MRDAYWRKCRMERVVDGDTMQVVIDVGFRLQIEERIRLLGVNAPEMRTAEGPLAKAWANEWFLVHTHQPMRWPFMLRTEKSDSFDRWLGVIECCEGHVLNDDLLTTGHAERYRGREA